MMCKCGKRNKIERTILESGHEVEVEYCQNCMILWECTLTGFEKHDEI